MFIKQGGNGTNANGDAKNVTKRSSGTVTGEAPAALMVNVSLLQYLDTGNWFVSVYNDDVRPHEVCRLYRCGYFYGHIKRKGLGVVFGTHLVAGLIFSVV